MEFDVTTQPPHDMIGEPIAKNLPRGKNSELLIDLMARSQQYLEEHDINRVRKDLGENPVSSIWLWGQGKKAQMDSFEKRFGTQRRGHNRRRSGQRTCKTHRLRSDLPCPAQPVLSIRIIAARPRRPSRRFEKYDIVFVHVEAPTKRATAAISVMKKKAVEQIDKLIVGPVFEALQKYPQWRMLVMPDHPTPVRTQAHSAEPVPFAMAGTNVTGVFAQALQ